jgi:hypothetical protein
MSEEVSEVKKEEIKISLKRCPFSYVSEGVVFCDENCKWNIHGDCLMERLVCCLESIGNILYNMYHHEKYEKRL